MRVLDGGSGWLDPVVISSDNTRIATGDYKQRGIRLFELSDGSVRRSYKKHVLDLCFYPDTNHVVLATEEELLLHNWETGTNEPLGQPRTYKLVASPGGELITLVEHFNPTATGVGRWAVGSGGKIERVSEARLGPMNHTCYWFWPDGSRLIAILRTPTHTDSRGLILSLPGGEEVGSFAIPTDWPKQILVSPDSKQIAAAEHGTSLFVWDGPDWKAFRQIKIGGRRSLTGLAYHPSGKQLAAASNDETVRVFDTTTWEEVRKYTWKAGKLRNVTYSPDGTLAAAGTDSGKVIVWDVDE